MSFCTSYDSFIALLFKVIVCIRLKQENIDTFLLFFSTFINHFINTSHLKKYVFLLGGGVFFFALLKKHYVCSGVCSFFLITLNHFIWIMNFCMTCAFDYGGGVNFAVCVCMRTSTYIHMCMHMHLLMMCVYAYECAVMCASHTFILILYKHWNSIDQILEKSHLNKIV